MNQVSIVVSDAKSAAASAPNVDSENSAASHENSALTKSLECPICFDQFVGDVPGASADLHPRILRCGHTFCTGCLKRIVPRQGNIRLVCHRARVGSGI